MSATETSAEPAARPTVRPRMIDLYRDARDQRQADAASIPEAALAETVAADLTLTAAAVVLQVDEETLLRRLAGLTPGEGDLVDWRINGGQVE